MLVVNEANPISLYASLLGNSKFQVLWVFFVRMINFRHYKLHHNILGFF